jgi:hypothetical protein
LAVNHQVSIALGALALDALSASSVEQLRAKAAHAIRYYLSDKESERASWRYPSFVTAEDDGGKSKLSVTLDSALWGSLNEEAADQGVPPEKLAQHAILYFLADQEAGRASSRIRAA